jgi:hypothetical protein
LAGNKNRKFKDGNNAMENQNVNSIYEIIGKLAVGYSELEYLTERVLTLMIAQNDFMVEPLLVRPLSFSRKIEMIEHCIVYHFSGDQNNKNKHKDLLSRIDNMRTLRNNLIHGDWLIDEYERNKNHVIVRNYKLKYHKKDNYWTDLKEDRYTIDQLNKKHKELQAIIEEIRLSIPEYEKLETRSWLDTASPEDIEKFKKDIIKLIDEQDQQ